MSTRRRVLAYYTEEQISDWVMEDWVPDDWATSQDLVTTPIVEEDGVLRISLMGHDITERVPRWERNFLRACLYDKSPPRLVRIHFIKEALFDLSELSRDLHTVFRGKHDEDGTPCYLAFDLLNAISELYERWRPGISAIEMCRSFVEDHLAKELSWMLHTYLGVRDKEITRMSNKIDKYLDRVYEKAGTERERDRNVDISNDVDNLVQMARCRDLEKGE